MGRFGISRSDKGREKPEIMNVLIIQTLLTTMPPHSETRRLRLSPQGHNRDLRSQNLPRDARVCRSV